MTRNRAYFARHIPAHADDPAFTSLRGLSDLVAIFIRNGHGDAERHHLWFEGGHLRQGQPPRHRGVRTSFELNQETFEQIVAGELTPQAAFFTLRLAIHGDVVFGLQLGTLLSGFFRRHPWRAEEATCA